MSDVHARRSAHPRLVSLFTAAVTSVALLGGPASAQSSVDAQNVTLRGSNNLNGATGGEGFAMKIASTNTAHSTAGHRYLYAATEGYGDPVACFSVIDVQNAAAPIVKEQIPISLGGANAGQAPNGTAAQRNVIRCNSLDLAGNTLVVAQETSTAGVPGAGLLTYDISDPGNPKLLAYFNTAGGYSHGSHHIWFSDPHTVWVAGGAGNTAIPHLSGDPYGGQVFVPKRTAMDFQMTQVVDVTNPAAPKEKTRWYYPGVSANDPRPAPDGLPGADQGVRMHNVDVFPQRPNRAYVSYLDGGIVILDIANPYVFRPVTIFKYRGPGFTHTTYPVFNRNLLEVSEEAFGPPPCADGPKRATIWSIVDEHLPVLLGSAPFLNTTQFCPPTNSAGNTGRYGSHNIWEGKPFGPSWSSDSLMLDAFFRGGLRLFNFQNPFFIQDVAHYIPAYNPSTNTTGSIQINDIYVDDRAYMYIVDRFGDGLYILSSPLVNCGSGRCHQ